MSSSLIFDNPRNEQLLSEDCSSPEPVAQENNSLEEISDQPMSADEASQNPILQSESVTDGNSLDVDERIFVPLQDLDAIKVKKSSTIQPEIQTQGRKESETIIFEYEEDYETDL